jgi:hypothetical protein
VVKLEAIRLGAFDRVGLSHENLSAVAVSVGGMSVGTRGRGATSTQDISANQSLPGAESTGYADVLVNK